jgi:predicted dehydrogenase
MSPAPKSPGVTHQVAFVGTGADPDDPDMDGFAMAYHHAFAYEGIESCELAACADVVAENAERFAAEFEVGEANVYADHEAMLAAVEPDIVSVAVPPAAHAPIVTDCARAGVDAVHCEKPMALTWGGARRMARECWRRNVQLTFNHQRRYARPWARAKDLLDDGEIGPLERIETACPNLYDWGTHCMDLCSMFVDEVAPEWVIGNVDYREADVWFGAHNENQALAHWAYENGVRGLASMGTGQALVGARHRLVGSEGEIQVRTDDGADLRIRRHEDPTWEEIEAVEEEWTDPIGRAIADVVRCLDEGDEPPLSARNALNGTELIFGTWESARRRGRVDFPLDIEDNPLAAMVESGALTPESAEE